MGKAATGPSIVEDPEIDSLGPAMRALNASQRRFAIAAAQYPLAKDWQIAKAAGYSDKSHGALRVAAHRLFHDEKVLAAIKECADKDIRGTAIMGVAIAKKIARMDGHRDQLKAALALIGLAGFTVDQNININQNVTDNSGKALMERIRALAQKHGLDENRLLGVRAPDKVVDAEFSEVGSADGD